MNSTYNCDTSLPAGLYTECVQSIACVCVCVCVCVYMYVCVYVYMYICVYVCNTGESVITVCLFWQLY